MVVSVITTGSSVFLQYALGTGKKGFESFLEAGDKPP